MDTKWLFGGFAGVILTTSAAVTLSSDGTLKEVEVIFYDKDTTDVNAAKKVKVPLDNLNNRSYFKYENNGSFEWIIRMDQ